MTCETYRTLVEKPIGESTSAERVATQRHFETCPTCRAETQRKLHERLKGLSREEVLALQMIALRMQQRDIRDAENKE